VLPFKTAVPAETEAFDEVVQTIVVEGTPVVDEPVAAEAPAEEPTAEPEAAPAEEGGEVLTEDGRDPAASPTDSPASEHKKRLSLRRKKDDA